MKSFHINSLLFAALSCCHYHYCQPRIVFSAAKYVLILCMFNISPSSTLPSLVSNCTWLCWQDHIHHPQQHKNSLVKLELVVQAVVLYSYWVSRKKNMEGFLLFWEYACVYMCLCIFLSLFPLQEDLNCIMCHAGLSTVQAMWSITYGYGQAFRWQSLNTFIIWFCLFFLHFFSNFFSAWFSGMVIMNSLVFNC